MVLDSAGWQLRCFIVALVVFHSSEFMLAIFYGRCAGVQSLLLTMPYLVALTAGLAEYGLESWLVPQFKTSTSIAYSGLVLMVMGEVIRKLAIVTAQSNFTHDIKISHEEGHKLVTHGIYRFVRHPSYLGFFIFAIGTQVMLCNPVMTIAYAIVLWRFFADRIEYEESFLHEFFGHDYVEYSNRTPSGMPFMS
ncbi:unnamed protein product [Calypogeia fissa]